MPVLVLLMLALDPPTEPLERSIREAIAASGAEAAVAWKTLDGRDQLLIDADRPFHAASTMKVPVMIALYEQARAGTLTLEDSILISTRFRSIVDGSPYELSETSDSDKEIYEAVGRPRSLAALCRAMIAVSSNLATNLLIERLGVERIRQTVARLEADAHGGMQVLRGVEDDKAFAQGLNNTTTARGLLTLFERLARGEAVDRSSDDTMIEMLAAQRYSEGIAGGLPPGTRVAHKPGSITRINHDAGIVYAQRPYVLVVLTRGLEDRKKSAELIAAVSRMVYDAAQVELTPRAEGDGRRVR
jgi:beta-lactamase class A